MTYIKTRAFIILPSIVVIPWGPRFQEQGPNPLTPGTLQTNNSKAGPPSAGWQPSRCSVSYHCPALASSNVLSCQQQRTCFSAGPHQRLGFAASRMLTTCFVRCPACLRNGTMKTLSFPGPWGCCFWIISAVCFLQSLHAAGLTRSPCQHSAPASAPLQSRFPPCAPHFVSVHR